MSAPSTCPNPLYLPKNIKTEITFFTFTIFLPPNADQAVPPLPLVHLWRPSLGVIRSSGRKPDTTSGSDPRPGWPIGPARVSGRSAGAAALSARAPMRLVMNPGAPKKEKPGGSQRTAGLQKNYKNRLQQAGLSQKDLASLDRQVNDGDPAQQ